MALYINDERIKIQQIENYSGDDLLLKKLQDALIYFRENFFSRGYALRFKYAEGMLKYNAKAQLKEGKKGIYISSRVVMDTDKGNSIITYTLNGRLNNSGTLENVEKGFWFRKTMVLTSQDIEQALFMYCFVPNVRAGQIVLEDLEKDALAKMTERERNAHLYYYLYNESSPLFAERDKLVQLAFVWGIINASAMSIHQLRNAIFDKVMLYEAQRNQDLNIDAFIRESKSLSPNAKSMALIQEAEGLGLLQWMQKTFTWILTTGTSREDTMEILRVASPDVVRRYATLAEYLTVNEKRKEIIEKSVIVAREKKSNTINPFGRKKEDNMEDEVPVNKDNGDELTEENWENADYSKKLAFAISKGLTKGRVKKEQLDFLIHNFFKSNI